MVETEVVVVNKLGLHARAAARFVHMASGFRSEVRLARGEREVNGKSIMGVMMLAASRGSRLRLTTDGCDELEAAQRLIELVEQRFGEPE
jgi:phosphocarrier protein